MDFSLLKPSILVPCQATSLGLVEDEDWLQRRNCLRPVGRSNVMQYQL